MIKTHELNTFSHFLLMSIYDILLRKEFPVKLQI